MTQGPSTRAPLRMRTGVVDVGSNSVRLVVFDGAERCPDYFFNEKVLCGLGAGLSRTGALSPEGRTRALAAIGRFMAIAGTMRLDRIIGVATAAVRDARDGVEFTETVRRETGLSLQIATGDEEARLAAQGVLMGWPEGTGLVMDMGGASMEMARLDAGAIGARATSALGPLALSDIAPGDRRKHIDKALKALKGQVGRADLVTLVGGSWRAISQLDMARREWPLRVLQGYETTGDHLARSADWIAKQEVATLQEMVKVSRARLTLMPLASEVLSRIIAVFEPERVRISSYGLREGVLYGLMPDPMRRSDPLLAACRDIEATQSRFPGFGDALYDWLSPVFTAQTAGRRRIIHAACLLHDIHWRTHPDQRAHFAFDGACRANFGGIAHKERVLMGAALAYRYENGTKAGLSPALLALLDSEERLLAERVGRLIRLGAMLTGSCGETLGDAALTIQDGVMTLRLGARAAPLYGEVPEKRLAKAARAFDCAPAVEITAPD